MLLLLRTNIWTFRPHRFMLRLRLKILQGVHANRSRYPLAVKRLICPRKYSVLQKPHLIPNLNIPDCAVLSVLISSIIIRSKMFFAVSIFFSIVIVQATDAPVQQNIDWRQKNESPWVTELQQQYWLTPDKWVTVNHGVTTDRWWLPRDGVGFGVATILWNLVTAQGVL